MIFADINLNQLRGLSKSTGALLSYINKSRIYLYYVNQGPVIFRSILKRDNNSQLFMLSIKPSIELRSELGKNPEVEDLEKQLTAQKVRVKENPLDLIK